MPRLLLVNSDRPGTTFNFEESALIGRGQFTDLQLDDATVSRRHAQLDLRDGGVFLTDLGSANGTLRNGQSVSGTVQVKNGDLLQFGQVSATLEIDATESTVPAASTELRKSPAASAAEGSPQPQQALFREVLSRVKLFAELGALASSHSDVESQVERFLQALSRAFPMVEQLAVLLYVPAADSFAVFKQISAIDKVEDPALLSRVAQQSMSHQQGLVMSDHQRSSEPTPSVVMSLEALKRASSKLGGAPLAPSLACMPVRFGAERMGALYMAASTAGAIKLADREVLAAAAGMLAWLLAAQQQAGPDLQVSASDFSLARRIQQRFLPQGIPELKGYQFADSYTSARAIGGDHYDYLTWPKGRHGVIVSDVSGKALSGALYVARLGAQLQHLARTATQPAALLESINAALYPEMESGMFITIAAVSLEPASGTVSLALAGHPPPLLRRANGEVDNLPAKRGMPIGATADARYEETRVQLEPGDLVLMFTDGLDEAQNKDRKLFGMDRIRQVLQSVDDPKSAIKALRDALGGFVGSQPQSDDLTLVCFGRDSI